MWDLHADHGSMARGRPNSRTASGEGEERDGADPTTRRQRAIWTVLMLVAVVESILAGWIIGQLGVP